MWELDEVSSGDGERVESQCGWLSLNFWHLYREERPSIIRVWISSLSFLSFQWSFLYVFFFLRPSFSRAHSRQINLVERRKHVTWQRERKWKSITEKMVVHQGLGLDRSRLEEQNKIKVVCVWKSCFHFFFIQYVCNVRWLFYSLIDQRYFPIFGTTYVYKYLFLYNRVNKYFEFYNTKKKY